MNVVEKILIRTRRTIREACTEAGIDFSSDLVTKIDSCTSCMSWQKFSLLRKDQDGNPICAPCYQYYGD